MGTITANSKQNGMIDILKYILIVLIYKWEVSHWSFIFDTLVMDFRMTLLPTRIYVLSLRYAPHTIDNKEIGPMRTLWLMHKTCKYLHWAVEIVDSRSLQSDYCLIIFLILFCRYLV